MRDPFPRPTPGRPKETPTLRAGGIRLFIPVTARTLMNWPEGRPDRGNPKGENFKPVLNL